MWTQGFLSATSVEMAENTGEDAIFMMRTIVEFVGSRGREASVDGDRSSRSKLVGGDS